TELRSFLLSFAYARVWILFLSLATVSVTGCGVTPGPGEPNSPSLSSIAVTPATPSIAVGATQQFTATGTYTDGSEKNITASVIWTSSTASTADDRLQ
ncbi:MAG TPA: Ig-like domain-containing protein, partial [Acidobacteriaceae bacterium]|nr:Ig-like domain-containing protein [Acidobacteriaceae bacterium]